MELLCTLHPAPFGGFFFFFFFFFFKTNRGNAEPLYFICIEQPY
jgi:hypothetical protein